MNVKESAKFIVSTSKHVQVNEKKCHEIAEDIYGQLKAADYSPDTWHDHELNPNKDYPAQDLANWIFTVDTLNFCFWSDRPQNMRYTVKYKDQSYTGYWALCAAVNRALDEGIQITSPSFWESEQFTVEKLAHIFRSETDETIPLLQERYGALKEAAIALKMVNASSFLDVLVGAKGSAQRVIYWLVREIPCYNDSYTYGGQKVCFYKRAQILIGDIWAAFGGKDYGAFDDMDTITMFADYRVPQILYGLGLLTYSPHLEKIVRDGVELVPGCPEECELRGASIQAVEVLVSAIRTAHPDARINAVLADFYLWDTAKLRETSATIPTHRVRSVFY